MGKTETETFVPRKQLDGFWLMDLKRTILRDSDDQPVVGTHLKDYVAIAVTANLQEDVLESWCPNLRYGSGVNQQLRIASGSDTLDGLPGNISGTELAELSFGVTFNSFAGTPE